MAGCLGGGGASTRQPDSQRLKKEFGREPDFGSHTTPTSKQPDNYSNRSGKHGSYSGHDINSYHGHDRHYSTGSSQRQDQLQIQRSKEGKVIVYFFPFQKKINFKQRV